VYLAGEVPDDGTLDITGQTEQVLAKIEKLLKQVGSDKTKLLSAQIFLPDMKDFAAMNAVWEKWVVAGQTPARATIEAKLANPAYKVEIMCVAAL
jgi:enamine deaminase RidA (YjgF/YER057c/UK114 family)